jgi:hypothetical protein
MAHAGDRPTELSDEGFEASMERLHVAASERTGYKDFGSPEYKIGLARLLIALDEGPTRAPHARVRAEDFIITSLAGRLATKAGWLVYPEVLATPIHPPLIIIGIPRTGTTALHSLLSADPQFQGFERWLAYAPMPRPPRDSWHQYATYQEARARAEARASAAPVAGTAHAVHAASADECLLPMSQSFVSNWFGSNLDVPLYDAWFMNQDETASYRHYADMLRLVGKNDYRRWLLKNPSHLMGIEALLTVFPEACIVQTHRNPANALASLVNLLAAVRDISSDRPTDRARLLHREIALWSEAARRTMVAQDRQPDRFFNVYQEELLADPMAVVVRIYDRFGFRLSNEAGSAMRAWVARNADGMERGHHQYPAITERAEIEKAFGTYVARHALV